MNMTDNFFFPIFRPLMRQRSIFLLTALLLFLPLAGCEDMTFDEEAAKAEVEAAIRAYLPKLAEAYATSNTQPLEGLAVDKEIARVSLRISELYDEGKIYRPVFKEMTIEGLSVWRYSNAFATTVEVWDVSSFALGSDVKLGDVADQRNRVKYQLKRKDTGWVILYRDLDQSLE